MIIWKHGGFMKITEKINLIQTKIQPVFTTTELNQLGVSSSEISKLINLKILTRLNRGVYGLYFPEEVKENQEPLTITPEIPNKEAKFSKAIDKIFRELINGNKEQGLKSLHTYLETKNVLQYEYLFIKLIELCITDQDYALTNFMFAITALDRGVYNPNINWFITSYYEYLTLGEIEAATICLDIIEKYFEDKIFIKRISYGLRLVNSPLDLKKEMEYISSCLSLDVKEEVIPIIKIPNYQEIMELILEFRAPLIKTCLSYGLNLKECNYIKLKVAEECLERSKIPEAKKLIKEVSASPNLDEDIAYHLEKTRKKLEVNSTTRK